MTSSASTPTLNHHAVVLRQFTTRRRGHLQTPRRFTNWGCLTPFPLLHQLLLAAQQQEYPTAGKEYRLVSLHLPPAPVLQNDVYNVTSGKRTGVRETWPDAGDATQGVPGGHVVKVHVIVPRETRRRRTAYVVFEGLRPGIYNTWEEVKPLVKRVPGNIHQGFDTCLEAERAYVVAYALGAVRMLPSRDDAGSQLVSPAIPTPEAIMAAFSSASDNFLSAEWHIVFKGLRPGVYPAWNFAATQMKGIRCAIYQKYASKAEAEEAYADALHDHYVKVLENN
ncbi:hypothetical protein PILCRDRAFT_92724 [Piloderma croceum F 1598]|uniref:Ribonuclease H1 N-terminal domain-containing protein n=1 Tax=Piloderma croceum (strain F 1598) TaxID=765440 RepID=A0A0C3AK32_PILCF|nr:hypothetical protein PILCRDRAFT_92724 [Piloderma croceum F 1598]